MPHQGHKSLPLRPKSLKIWLALLAMAVSIALRRSVQFVPQLSFQQLHDRSFSTPPTRSSASDRTSAGIANKDVGSQFWP
mmetsp:Transcript_32565/g.69826  ORF Transcript_32565/g.69826 Transcript_32565/m.69826 type:complete len:80 (+) Transcript_32565:168-407(+)